MQKFFELSSDCDGLDLSGHGAILKKGTIGSIVSRHEDGVEVCTLNGNYHIRNDLFDKSIKRYADSNESAMDVDFIWDQLKTVNDPEVNVNIVDLGLVYGIDVVSSPGNSRKIVVEMTLTSPTCPLGEVLQQEVVDKISSTCAADEVVVNFVWDPPWSKDMITEPGRMELGWQ
ncbi:MAG: iron-sulfur cluster assembly protein [Puniceicoccales bacterium]|jgi:metal-sulfur cluster biosynthetic enzyme|nr:iron-sulfur cluster assembly protein [Puniceicoccales bacterium]